jgi:hypothetical protein
MIAWSGTVDVTYGTVHLTEPGRAHDSPEIDQVWEDRCCRIFAGGGMQLIDLPAGWSRITRRPFERSGPAVLVADIEGDGTDAFYQRWPDGAEIVP